MLRWCIPVVVPVVVVLGCDRTIPGTSEELSPAQAWERWRGDPGQRAALAAALTADESFIRDEVVSALKADTAFAAAVRGDSCTVESNQDGLVTVRCGATSSTVAGAEGLQGPKGGQGPPGDQGPQGEPGLDLSTLSSTTGSGGLDTNEFHDIPLAEGEPTSGEWLLMVRCDRPYRQVRYTGLVQGWSAGVRELLPLIELDVLPNGEELGGKPGFSVQVLDSAYPKYLVRMTNTGAKKLDSCEWVMLDLWGLAMATIDE